MSKVHIPLGRGGWEVVSVSDHNLAVRKLQRRLRLANSRIDRLAPYVELAVSLAEKTSPEGIRSHSIRSMAQALADDPRWSIAQALASP